MAYPRLQCSIGLVFIPDGRYVQIHKCMTGAVVVLADGIQKLHILLICDLVFADKKSIQIYQVLWMLVFITNTFGTPHYELSRRYQYHLL